MKTLQDKIIALGVVVVGPFTATASIEFLPWWLSTPIVFLTTLFWLGTMILIGEYAIKKDLE